MHEHAESTCGDHIADVEALHQRCGVYTRSSVVRTLLDAIGWDASNDLSEARLLEPAAGDGAFVVEAASRLLASLAARNVMPTASVLTDRIVAFEIHPGEAERGRSRIADALVAGGLSGDLADDIARQWMRTDDFLLDGLSEGGYTHVAGNPPYSRWSRIPEAMRRRYERTLPRRMTHGDLFLPFLDLGIGCLEPEGRLGFVCSDRWRNMAFAEGFRRARLPEVIVELDEPVGSDDVYERRVDVYPSLLVMRRRTVGSGVPPIVTERSGRTLAEAGYRVRVGPALGHTPAFVLEPDEADVEEELLAHWVDAREIMEGRVEYRGRRVIAMHDGQGRLQDLDEFPLASDRFERHRDQLERRSIVRLGAPWFRPIDRVVASEWHRPKLLIPELAKVPRVAFDLSGSVPSHGVYAIFAPDDDLEELYDLLRDGGLEKGLYVHAPRVKGGYIRAYKHVLDRMILD